MPTKEDRSAAYRARYAALEAGGQAPKNLPGPSPRPAPACRDEDLIHRETIPGSWYWTTVLRSGESLRLQTGDDPSCVSLLGLARR